MFRIYREINRWEQKEQKMNKRIIVILLVLFLTGNIFGQGLGFQAIENGGKVTITGYTGNEKNLTIPGTANGMPIVAIGKEAFRGKGLISITIPASVTAIEAFAFADNNQLTNITIGANVTLVAEINSWGEGTFSFGYGFDNAYNNGGKPAGSYKRDSTQSTIWGMTSGDYLYIGSNITRYIGSGGAVTIPSTINGTPVTSIESSAFYDKRLTSVIIPNSVLIIGTNAFLNNQLTSVTIGNSVKTIGENAFSRNRLTSLTIPNSVTNIGNSAFSSNQLTSVTIGNGVTSIGAGAFSGNRLTSVTIGSSVTTIGGEAFRSNLLTSVVIPNSVSTIGDYAFADNQLISITIGPNVQLLGGPSDAFPRSFVDAYNGVAGTYTRASTSSDTWTKGTFTF